jgi:hypothetical protein
VAGHPGLREGHQSGKPFGLGCRRSARRLALAEGMGIRGAACLVGTGNATVARIAAEMRAEALKADG